MRYDPRQYFWMKPGCVGWIFGLCIYVTVRSIPEILYSLRAHHYGDFAGFVALFVLPALWFGFVLYYNRSQSKN